MTAYAPIVQISYNRASVLHETLVNLAQCEGIENHDIYAFVDGPRTDADCPKIEANIKVLEDFKQSYLPRMQIIRREHNLGGVKNMIESISNVLERFGRAIIIEDDILVSRTFLKYINAGLRLYENDKRIWAINGYIDHKMRIEQDYPHDIFLAPRHSAWGWGTWKDRWAAVDFSINSFMDFIHEPSNIKLIDRCGKWMLPMLKAQYEGRLNTWDVQCTYHMIRHGLYTIRPRKSMTKNNGMGTECEHCRIYNADFAKQRYFNLFPSLVRDIEPNEVILKRFSALEDNSTLPVRATRKVFRLLKGLLGDNHREPENC